MVRRHEITDEAWERIAPVLPEAGRRNGRWRDHRQVRGGIVWKLTTGVPWRDIPKRHRRWTGDGTWDKVLSQVQVHDDGAPVQWTVHVDSTVVGAHSHAAGARKRGLRQVQAASSRSTVKPSAAPAGG